MSRTKIVVGSRSSKLALIQAKSVVARIREANPHIEVSLIKIVTKGDRNRHAPLDHMEGVRVFVADLEKALLDGIIDLAVHSLKDMPTQVPQGLCLTAVTERLDPRDVLISGTKRLDELIPGSKIGTGSRRRAAQLTAHRPDLKVCSLRGNVDTRLRKVSSGELDGVILAAAAMERLQWEDRISEYLPLEYFLPAVGQGALGIETQLGNEEITRLTSPINHLPTWQGTTAERVFLRALGGGCQTPIAALGTVKGDTLKLEGMVASVSGKRIIRTSAEGSTTTPEEVGEQLTQRMLSMGATELITEARVR